MPWARAGAHAKQMALFGAGVALLAVGGALLVLPGPGLPLVVGGLALLAPRVVWARRLRDRLVWYASSAARKR
jgi:hypothetical protein